MYFVRIFISFTISVLQSQAQVPTGEIRLEVKDPSNAAVQASGQLRGSRQDRQFETDAQGIARIAPLPYGRYRLDISKTGFATQIIELEVASATPVSRVITLALARSRSTIDVVHTTPLPGVDLTLDQIAAPVQSITQLDLARSGALDLSDLLNRRLNGVHLNEIQGNPFQSDLNYRGYTASPLLGTPQGVSIYMDGVRLNQPFGDTVNWDLLPRIAISETILMPGSNPLFGLNTLGGAVAIKTKDGQSNPGTSVQAVYGSNRRRTAELEHGGAFKELNWFLASNLFFERGWRDASGSNVRQFFSKFGWQHGKTNLGLSVSYANNSLIGNALQEQRFLERDYTSVYTKPDITNNKSPFVNFTARHSPSTSFTLSGNAYYRNIASSTFNGDINEASLDQSVYQPNAADRAALNAAGFTGFPLAGATAANTPFPFWRCIAQGLLRDEPGEKCNGLLNRSYIDQTNYGGSAQFTLFGSTGGKRNQFTGGATVDRSAVDFRQTTQLGFLNPDRTITGINAYADGVTGGNVDGIPFDSRVNLGGRIHTWSLFATDTLSLGKALNLTLSGRYNRTSINNTDRIRPGGGKGSLDGQEVLGRFNPSVGITYGLSEIFNVYLGYSEGSRGPTSIELGCADPEQPCRLPNSVAGDPPLDQVVARTLEAGARGKLGNAIRWNAGVFRGENTNDILFVTSSRTGFGYFKNFGKTRRQGFELAANRTMRRVTLGGGYTFVEATYRTAEVVNGTGNSSNNAEVKGLAGSIKIVPGDNIPLIPQQMLKGFADWNITSKLTADFGLIAMSGSSARGNENNKHAPDGTYYLGPGRTPAYAVVNLGGRYQFNRRVLLLGQINNLFDRRYYSAAQLGPTAFGATGNFVARPLPAVGANFPIPQATFYAPGAPRLFWVGLRFQF